MIKILIINSWLHEKNKQGLMKILNYLQEHQQEQQGQKIEYKIGSIADIPAYNIIYSPSQAINAANYPQQKFIFGPHFSSFPNNQQLQSLQANVHQNCIYIQPSEWAVQSWKNMGAEQFIPIKTFPFPVDTQRFSPLAEPTKNKENVLVYYKHRYPADFNQLIDFLNKNENKNIERYRLFDYRKRYNEADYLSYLQTCKYGIVLDAHESQGFAIEEALACNVPLLVWNTQTMSQEIESHHPPIPCTSIPYWDERCGEYFHHHGELEAAFQTFQTKLAANQYSPRQYILENLSTEKCAERFMELIAF